ncbi:MAG: exodeoxyribonuclease V subunit alpha [Opitutales bacterium]
MNHPRPAALLASPIGRLLAEGASGNDADRLREIGGQLMAAIGEGHPCLALDPADEADLARLEAADPVTVLTDPGPEDDPGTPFILDRSGRAGPRLYLHRYFTYEQRLAAGLAALIRRRAPTDDRPDLVPLLAGLPDRAAATARTVINAALADGLTLITGGPGTGKTSLVASIFAALDKAVGHGSAGQPLAIALAAPTGKAAARLGDALAAADRRLPSGWRLAGEPATLRIEPPATLHRLLGIRPDSGRPRHGPERPLRHDLIVVDEASMVDLALMHDLLAAIDPARTRLILLGDSDQLASVEAGAVLADLARPGEDRPWAAHVHQLTHNWRFRGGDSLGELCAAIRSGRADTALDLLADPDQPAVGLDALPPRLSVNGLLDEGARDALRSLVEAATPAEALAALDRHLLLCGTNTGPLGTYALNRLIATWAADRRGLAAGQPRFDGMPLLVTENAYGLGLFNGDRGVFFHDPEDPAGPLWAWFADPADPARLRRFAPARLPAHLTAYALTVHRAQGSEADRVTLVVPGDGESPLPPTREWGYTAVSRARETVRILGDRGSVEALINRPTERISGLARRLTEALNQCS